jgi:Uma2 family endonuclease
MEAAVAQMSAAEYLAAELESETRHEFLAGEVFAMAGASLAHNIICGNIFVALHTALRGKPCRAFMADVKLRIETRDGETYYYPDILVICDPRDTGPLFVQFPKVVIEVMSETTARIDMREKLWCYTNIESVEEYVLVSQSSPEATVFRRANHWIPEKLSSLADTLRLESLAFSLPLSKVYEGVEGIIQRCG